MSCKPLTKKEWDATVAEAFGAAVDTTYKDLLDAAVKAEREAIIDAINNMVIDVDKTPRTASNKFVSAIVRYICEEVVGKIQARGQL